jgi:hypothetical protein
VNPKWCPKNKVGINQPSFLEQAVAPSATPSFSHGGRQQGRLARAPRTAQRGVDGRKGKGERAAERNSEAADRTLLAGPSAARAPIRLRLRLLLAVLLVE